MSLLLLVVLGEIQKKIDNIIFTGLRNDLKKIYQELDIAVHPSHSENVGGASESLAAAVPTVTTNVGGFTDVIIDGKTGYLCLPKNPNSLADSIDKVLTDYSKAKKMALLGQKKVKKIFDINNSAKRVKDIYLKIIKRGD